MGFTAGIQEEHRYQLCRDEDCDRFPCRIYREGYRNGHEDGYAEGCAAGYASGFAEGLASCPGPHSGG
jgi:flagellar biosynthesis/type III secretory pathway protein FliH